MRKSIRVIVLIAGFATVPLANAGLIDKARVAASNDTIFGNGFD